MRPLRFAHRVIDLDEVDEIVMGSEVELRPDMPMHVTYCNGEIWRFVGEDAEMIRTRPDASSFAPVGTMGLHHVFSHLEDDLS